jgi:alpha-tubulin suppressor-like RCC1 family protein
LVSSGAAYCWGANDYGEHGDGTTTSSETPVAVAGGLTFAKISVGYLYTCGVTAAGAAYCWGVASTLPNSTVPAAVGGGLTWSDVSVGSWYNCGISTAGAAYCWGDNSYGQLGADSATLAAAGCPGLSVCAVPVPVAGGLTFATVRAGFAATCGITASGAAYCWGDNASGELGYGSSTGPQSCMRFDEFGQQEIQFPCSTTPVAVAGGLTLGSIAASSGHACGLSTSGTAYCWGANAAGELGNGTATAPGSCQTGSRCAVQPTAVTGGLRFASIQAGQLRTCAVTASNVAYCWGSNQEGAVGDGTTTDRTSPTAVSGGLAFTMVVTAGWSPGGGHSCGVTVTGVAYCWGENYNGQLGDGTASNSSVPVKVAGQP